jgi:glycosyltransferase involved in cell wall biosynthesis
MKVSNYSQWNKIEVAPLGIDPAVFAPLPFRDAPETFEVVCVGRLASVKAQHILIDAIDHLRKQNWRVRLRLIGDGPDRKELEQNVAARGLTNDVIFEGWRNQDQVLAFYEQADIFALASFAEGVPVALMEAMAMEIPCVATRITGLPELIRDGVDGLLVTPSSVEELVEAIAKLMSDPELRRRLARAGRVRVMEKYELARNTAHLASIIRCRIIMKERFALKK